MLFLRLLFKNHRIIEWLRLTSHLDSGGHLVKLCHLNRATCPELCPGGFWDLHGLRSYHFSGCPVISHPQSEKVVFMFRWAFLCFSLHPASLILWLHTALKYLSLSLEFVIMNKIPLSLLFVILCWTLSSTSISLLYWGVQSWCGVTSTEQMWGKLCKDTHVR